MAKRDYYEVSASAARPPRPSSSTPFASSPCSIIRTAIPGDKAAEAQFKEINEAYEILRTRRSARPTTSSAIRRSSRAWAAAGAARRAPASTSAASPTSSTTCSATSWAAGQRRGRAGGGRGADLRYNLTITLEEAFAGKQAQIRVPTTVACEVCSGTGSEAGSEPAACPTCRGTGRVRASRASSPSSAPARPARAPAG